MGSKISIITAALSKEVVLRTLPDGRSVADLNLPVDVREGSGANATNVTEWHKISVFGAQADAAKKNLAKGSIVMVTVSNIVRRIYAKNDGTEGVSFEGVADSLRYIANFGGQYVADQGGDVAPAGAGASNVDDIPF
jgi:single-strand DNA-binding protein